MLASSSEPAGDVAVAAASTGELAASDSDDDVTLTPDRYGNLVEKWKANGWGDRCFRCKERGHWAGECPLNSPVVEARYPGACSLCGAMYPIGTPIAMSDSGDWVHVRCQLGDVSVGQDRLKYCPTEEASSSEQAALEAAIRRTIRETTANIGVNACAGSGKTHLIASTAAELRAEGSNLLAVTLNRDARKELADREFGKRARTFHSIGFGAWRRHSKQSKMVSNANESDSDSDGDDEGEDDDDASESSASSVVNKTRLILQALYPKEPSTHWPLEYSLLGPYVEHMVGLGKMGALGIDEARGGVRDDDAGWRALEDRYDATFYIERKLKKLKDARKREVMARWPTATTRADAGRTLAKCVFAASVTCALEREWGCYQTATTLSARLPSVGAARRSRSSCRSSTLTTTCTCPSSSASTSTPRRRNSTGYSWMRGRTRRASDV